MIFEVKKETDFLKNGDIDSINYENKVKKHFELFTDNGKYLHSEILKLINETEGVDKEDELSVFEKDKFENLNDIEFTQLSFMLSAEEYATSYGVDMSKIVSCVGIALGLDSIYELYQNTRELANFGEVVTSKEAKKLAKLLIKDI